MNRFNRIRHHVDMKDVKKRHLEESAARKLEEKRIKEEIEQINSEYEKRKSDWRDDLKESDWTPVDSPITNSTSQRFNYSVGNLETGEPNTFTVSGLGGVESLPSSVEVDFGFGENPPGGVNPPSYNQLALAGYAKPILMKRRDTEDVNPRLDASQEFAQKVNADVMMNARVKTGELSLEQKKEFVEIYKNDMEEWNKNSEARARENVRRRKSNISKVRSYVSKFGAILDKMEGFETFMKITQGGKKLIVVHQNNVFRDFSDKFNVTVYEAAKGKRISKIRGSFGKVTRSMFDNPFTKGKSSGQATIMYDGIGGEVESKNFEIKELPPIPMPTPPKFMQKNMDKGWQPSVTSSYDQEFINKMNAWFNTIPTGGANFPAKLAINLAKGDLNPVTESPGPVITSLIKQNIIDNLAQGNSKSDKLGTNSYWDSKSGKGAIRYDMYKSFSAKMAPVSAALGQYSIERTDKGIRIRDTYDISGGFTSPGGAAIFDPLTKLIGGKDVQSTGETLTAIAARRAAELGYDMVDADSGKTLKPVYSGEEEFNSRTYPNSGAPTIATPKGFNIKIDFTIPWDSFSPETAALLKIGGSKKVDPLQSKTDRTGYGYDTKGKLDSSGYGMDPNRDTETEARPIKPSKTVKKIKSMVKTKRKSLSLDEPIVRRKKES